MSVPGLESQDTYTPMDFPSPTAGGRGRTRRRRSSRKGMNRSGKKRRGGTAHKMPSVGGRRRKRGRGRTNRTKKY